MKILIVKSSALGDIVHAFPAVGFIKEQFPCASIDWVVEKPFASLVASHPAVNRTLVIDTKIWRKGFTDSAIRNEILNSFREIRREYYDVIFDLQANMKSGIVTVAARGKAKVGYSWSGVSEWPNLLCTNRHIAVPLGLSVRDDYLNLVQQYFDHPSSFNVPVILKLTEEDRSRLASVSENLEKIDLPIVMVCHGSNWKNKQVPFDVLSEFLTYLQTHLGCYFLFTWGSEKEKDEATSFRQKFINSAVLEKLSLAVLQHVMAKMKLVVAMDSLPLHLAATTSVPTFSIFGASLASRYAPTGVQNRSFQGECPYGRKFPTRCPVLRSCKTGACIRGLTGKQLFEAFLRA